MIRCVDCLFSTLRSSSTNSLRSGHACLAFDVYEVLDIVTKEVVAARVARSPRLGARACLFATSEELREEEERLAKDLANVE
jgi:hypothetical protein